MFEDTANFLFDGWIGPGRLLLVGPLAYLALVLFVRISGKRALSKLNSFDLVVTVALGSSLATTLGAAARPDRGDGLRPATPAGGLMTLLAGVAPP